MGDHQIVRRLTNEWQRALAGDATARAQWCVVEGGAWEWSPEGVRLSHNGTEWCGLGWERWGPYALKSLRNCLIEVTISGKAEAAGLSFGSYKDFMAPLEPGMGPQRFQFEVDVTAGCWSFRVDGQLMNRSWMDAGVRSVDDLIAGVLTLKARDADEVLFQDLTIHRYEASCQLSVIITCYRFQQRLKVTLRNWCHQTSPTGAYELLVVNPRSADGTHEHLSAVAGSYPDVRVRNLEVGAYLSTNKGAMINRGVEASRGQVIWLADADCLFPPTGFAAVMEHIRGSDFGLLYGERRYLTAAQTDALLSGRVDGLAEFEKLSQAAGAMQSHSEPWGYTQIVHRSVLESIPYHEEMSHFADSDNFFVEDCAQHQIMPERVEGLRCLHLNHPFAWFGTKRFL